VRRLTASCRLPSQEPPSRRRLRDQPVRPTQSWDPPPFVFASNPWSSLETNLADFLSRPKQIAAEVLTFADLILNTKAHTVYRAKREVHLTPKEFMLLEYLLRNQGAVLPRSMILEHVWNMDTDPFSNTIESHVLSLRRKIDPDGKKSIIHTVPGVGYKIG
jgi:DNA-binding response OmpR family regulator